MSEFYLIQLSTPSSGKQKPMTESLSIMIKATISSIDIALYLRNYAALPTFHQKSLATLLIIYYNKGKITNLCIFMNETTDLLKILQIYVAFSAYMQFSKENYKSMHINERNYRYMYNITNLCLLIFEIIIYMRILSDLF